MVDLAEVALPDEPAQPIDKLRELLDGLQCKTCSFITVNKDIMRMHCKKKSLASVEFFKDRNLVHLAY